MPVLSAVGSTRERALKVLSELPPFAPVLDRLLATLGQENLSVSKVAEIIETDTIIAGNVLKVVNSALYGRRGMVTSVRHAVSLLGTNKLRNVVFGMSITRVWNQVHTAPGWSTARFNRRSVTCALLCDCLGQRLPIANAEGAFVAGLFHDLGQLLVAVAMHPEYQQVQQLYCSGAGTLSECEEKVLGTTHAELSAAAVAAWNLPPYVQEAVRDHSAPPKAQPGQVFPLSLAIACAEDYADEVCPVNPQHIANPELDRQPFAPLGISNEQADFMPQFEIDLEALAGALH